MKLIHFLFFLTLFMYSCKNNGVDPDDVNSFSLQLQLKDNNGNSLPNYNVSIINKLKFYSNIKKTTTEQNPLASTTLRYGLLTDCFVDLSLYDLEGINKETYVHTRQVQGYYHVWADLSHQKNYGTYKVKIVASSDSLKKNILFTDSIYVVFLQVDPVLASAGKTDSNGKIKITDKLRFPHLYPLPKIAHTTESSPDPLSYFTFSDSVQIVVSNESFSKSISFYKPVKDGINNYELSINSSSLKINSISNTKKIKDQETIVTKLTKPAFEWSLSQNFPNPFN